VGRTRRLLEDANDPRLPVEIEYFVASRNEWTARRVEIADVYAQNDTWYVSGHCGLRGDFRQFRLDHIRAVRVLDGEDDEGMPDPFAEE
jgi:predicted DNA-binding transcriptional regulator YafY